MAIKEQAPLLSAEDANKVIGFLSAARITPDSIRKKRTGWLMSCGKASGQPEQ
ncbi:hypothetical protein LJK87_17295 [Paenibacillus sp. P25]|nr:hypothetical protein LJK87_17295 [Paenibacillus sp. P25]